jgi:hypothetical protein
MYDAVSGRVPRRDCVTLKAMNGWVVCSGTTSPKLWYRILRRRRMVGAEREHRADEEDGWNVSHCAVSRCCGQYRMIY